MVLKVSGEIFDPLSIVLVIVVLLYVIGLILIAEKIRVKKGLSSYFTRRMIHLFAGDSIIVLPLFKHPIYPIIITIILALMVFIGLSRPNNPLSKTMVVSEFDKLHVYGPLYYIISILLLVVFFYNRPEIVVAATMIMAWGDGFASLIPAKLNKVHMIFNRGIKWRKSIEGSLSMFFFGFIGALIGLVLMMVLTSYSFDILGFIPKLLITCAIATIVELLSIGKLASFDNFAVPLISAIVLLLVS